MGRRIETPRDMLDVAHVEWTHHDASMTDELDMSLTVSGMAWLDPFPDGDFDAHGLLEEQVALRLMRELGIRHRVTPRWMSFLGGGMSDIHELLCEAERMSDGELRMRSTRGMAEWALFDL